MKLSDILAALLVVIIWGGNFVVIKIGLQGLPPILFTALRFLFAALPLVFFIPRPVVPLKLLAGYGLFQFALQFTLLFSGIYLGFPPGLASLVIQLQAFFTIGLAVLLLGERPLSAQIIGALIAFGAMGLVASQLDAKPTVIGFILVVLGGVCWSIANIYTKKIGKVNPMAIVAWGSLIATPPLLAASLVIEGSDAWVVAFRQWNWISTAAVLFQSYPNTLLGFGVWSMLIRKYPTAMVAPFTLLVPITGMMASAFFLNEPLQWWKIVAGILVLTGLAFNLFGPKLHDYFSRRAT